MAVAEVAMAEAAVVAGRIHWILVRTTLNGCPIRQIMAAFKNRS